MNVHMFLETPRTIVRACVAEDNCVWTNRQRFHASSPCPCASDMLVLGIQSGYLQGDRLQKSRLQFLMIRYYAYPHVDRDENDSVDVDPTINISYERKYESASLRWLGGLNYAQHRELGPENWDINQVPIQQPCSFSRYC